jgi:hypothetical protein
MVVVASPPSSRSQAVPLQTERGAVGMIYNCSTSFWCEMPISMGKTLGRLFEQRLRVPSYSCSLLRYLRPGSPPEVVGQDAPPYPPLHPFFCVIETYIQPEGTI